MPPRTHLSAVPSVTRGLKRPAAARTQKDSGGVQSLTRGLTLLEQLADSEGGISLTEISQRAGLAPSTAHRLLNTLADMGFVFQAPDSHRTQNVSRGLCICFEPRFRWRVTRVFAQADGTVWRNRELVDH